MEGTVCSDRFSDKVQGRDMTKDSEVELLFFHRSRGRKRPTETEFFQD